MNLDIGLDVTITGFEIAEIDLLLQEDSSDVDDELPADSGPSITNAGDMWVLGAHRILCGPSLSEGSFVQLMNDKRADVVFSDPPYNVKIDANVCGNGAIKHEEFAMASGEMSEEQFTSFLSESLSLLARYSRSGSVHFICMDFRHIGELTTAGKRVYDTLLNLCVWVRDNGGMGSSIALDMSWSLSSETARLPTVTTFNSADSEGTEQTFGSSLALTRCRSKARKGTSSPCTQR